jgi:Ca2+-binding EF-hand superfamily protein
MDYIKSYKHYFDLYDKEGKHKISGQEFKLILDSIGFGNEVCDIEDEEIITWNKFSITLTKLARKMSNDDNMIILFKQYANKEGEIDRNNLREMLSCHIDRMSKEEIENLVEDCMGEDSVINYDKFKTINIF